MIKIKIKITDTEGEKRHDLFASITIKQMASITIHGKIGAKSLFKDKLGLYILRHGRDGTEIVPRGVSWKGGLEKD